MPPRYAYWTIIAGGLPTAFRAADRDDLLPTFQRIKEKHPDAQMKWFARGKLWESPEAARAAQHRGGGNQRDARGPFRPRDDRDREQRGDRRDRRESRTPPAHRRSLQSGGGNPESRDRNWRPGGEHRDPRQKFIDVKKDRNARIRKERWEHKNAGDRKDFKPQPQRSEFRDRPREEPRDSGFRREQRPWDQKKPWDRKKQLDAKEPWPRDETRPSQRDAKKPWQRDANKPWQRDQPRRRAQETENPRQPKRPAGPNREPKPSENPEPTRPPKPDEPITPSPGPPEQGRGRQRPFRSQKRFSRGPRRG